MDHHATSQVELPAFLKPFGVLWGLWAMVGNWWNADHFLAVVSAIGPMLIGVAAIWNAATNARKAKAGK